MRWTGHTTRMREMMENLKGRDYLEHGGVDDRIILK
jgi:hypothetical protein